MYTHIHQGVAPTLHRKVTTWKVFNWYNYIYLAVAVQVLHSSNIVRIELIFQDIYYHYIKCRCFKLAAHSCLMFYQVQANMT